MNVDKWLKALPRVVRTAIGNLWIAVSITKNAVLITNLAVSITGFGVSITKSTMGWR